MKIVGIDLAGVPTRPTGFCVLTDRKAVTSVLHSDEEIVRAVRNARPSVVAIDAPLSEPQQGMLREIEHELRTRGIRFFPPKGLRAMETLTERGARLKRRLEEWRAIEVYPGGALDVWGVPRKDSDAIVSFLREKEITFSRKVTPDELDALVCAYIGKLFLENQTELLGNRTEGFLVMPR